MRIRSLGGVLLTRTLMGFGLILVTYNPTGLSFGSYLMGELGTSAIYDGLLVKLLCLGVLMILWWVFLHSMVKSLHMMAFVLALLLSLAAYIAFDKAGVALKHDGMVWTVEVLFAILLGLGISNGHIKAWFSGTRQVSDVDDHNS